MIDRAVVNELIENIASMPIENGTGISSVPDSLEENVAYFLSCCNGGYSRDNYFHFFGTTGAPAHNIHLWNAETGWKQFYGGEVFDHFYFAEDVFGNQFGLKPGDASGTIYMLWVDDGRVEDFADSFEEFVDFTVFGFSVFEKMRELCERYFSETSDVFTPYRHLSYKKPILLGGDSGDVGNLELCDAMTNLSILGQLVTQCRALPVGTRITNVLIDRDAQTIRLVTD